MAAKSRAGICLPDGMSVWGEQRGREVLVWLREQLRDGQKIFVGLSLVLPLRRGKGKAWVQTMSSLSRCGNEACHRAAMALSKW